MAGTAVATVAALVNIISEVTGSAFPGQWRINKTALMAGVALYFRMPALQCKAAGFGMVKCCLFPFLCLVTLLAVPAIFTFVVIIELMA